MDMSMSKCTSEWSKSSIKRLPSALALRGGGQLMRSGEHVARDASVAQDAPDGRVLGIAALELRGVFERGALSWTQLQDAHCTRTVLYVHCADTRNLLCIRYG